MIRRPPRSTQSRSSAASDVYKRQGRQRRTSDRALCSKHLQGSCPNLLSGLEPRKHHASLAMQKNVRRKASTWHIHADDDPYAIYGTTNYHKAHTAPWSAEGDFKNQRAPKSVVNKRIRARPKESRSGPAAGCPAGYLRARRAL